MKKFQFSLATVLQIRQQAETAARKELLNSHLFLQKMVDDLGDLDREGVKIKEAIRLLQKSHIDSAKISTHFEYLAVLKQRIIVQKTKIEKAQKNLEIQRQAVVKAMQKRKIIENFKEKQYSRWESEFQSIEKAFFDEIATIRYTRDMHERRSDRQE